MKTKGKWLSICLVFILTNMCFLWLAYALAPSFSFDDLFPASLQREMGLHKLTGNEKEALRAYVEKLLLFSATETSRKPAAISPNRPAAARYVGTGDGHWVKENIDSGTYIVLEDGSLWQIDPLEKIDAMLWLPISNITVLESAGGSIGYNYVLINKDDGDKAHAKYLGSQ